MKNLMPLMLREWLQHRFAWTLLVLVPLALAVTGLSIGQIQLDDDMTALRAPELALMLGVLSIVITSAVLFLLLGATSLFIALGSPRRDHGDRSVEFWLSLPSGHAESLAAPMLVHLLLVPAAALLIGFVAAVPVSLVVVGRVVGIGEWFALPWGQIFGTLSTLLLRVIAGLPLALLWLSPLLLAAMLANALFRRWGLPLLVVGLSLLGYGLERLFGAPLLVNALTTLFTHAATSLAGASGGARFESSESAPLEALSALPGWAVVDFGVALREMAHPMLAAALLLSAALFAALVVWRRRGASAT
jgi:ABC-2 type transport system permease protein